MCGSPIPFEGANFEMLSPDSFLNTAFSKTNLNFYSLANFVETYPGVIYGANVVKSTKNNFLQKFWHSKDGPVLDFTVLHL